MGRDLIGRRRMADLREITILEVVFLRLQFRTSEPAAPSNILVYLQTVPSYSHFIVFWQL